MNKDLLRKIIKYFGKNREIAIVYLYGSYATKKEKKESDIDLAVLFNGDSQRRSLKLILKYTSELENLLQKEVEIQDLTGVSTVFAFRVISEGKPIVVKNEKTRVDFEINILNQYFDQKYFLEKYYHKISQLAYERKINARPFTH